MHLLVSSLGLIVLLHVGLCLTSEAARQGDPTAQAQQPAAAMAGPSAVDAAVDAAAGSVPVAEPSAAGDQVDVEPRYPRLPMTDHHVGCGSAPSAGARTGGFGSSGAVATGPPDPVGSNSVAPARPRATVAASWPLGAETGLLTRLSVSLM
jgi:hypothetical protein